MQATTVEVDDGSGFRPLSGALVPDLQPVVRITILASGSTLSRVVHTYFDGPPDAAGNVPPPSSQDLTGLFGPLGAGQSATAELDLAPGSHTLRITLRQSQGTRTFELGFLAFASGAREVFTPVYSALVTESGLTFEGGTLLLSFVPGAPLSAMSSGLNRIGLAPLDWSSDTGLVRARILNGRSPLEVGEQAAANIRPPLIAVLPNLAMMADDAIGEQMPSRLTNTYRQSANDTCKQNGNARRGCFERGGDARDELRVFRYHFYYDSFAGHRLVNHLVRDVNTPENVGLAVLDTGFGNGQNPSNIPNSAFFNFAEAPFYDRAFRRFNANGVQECRRRATDPWAACNFGFADVRDVAATDRAPHGTSVTVTAAGRAEPQAGGNAERAILGTGPHAQVRVMRLTVQIVNSEERLITWDQVATAVVGAARDPSVQVINTSLGHLAAAAPAEWVNANIEGAALNIVNFARTQGKIWVASAGNDGRCTDPSARAGANPCSLTTVVGHWPSDFAPGPGPRAATDPLILSVGNVGTSEANTGPEQLSNSSNFGPRVSVAAGGDDVVLITNDGSLATRSGTSFSSPAAAGLAAEMVYLDRNVRPANQRLTPLQIVELIEATADDLGTVATGAGVVRPNNKPADGLDLAFGHGRINVWKALLAVANRGTATNRTADFPSLPQAPVNSSTWYGFAIQSPVFDATVWINGVQVQDPQAVRPTGSGLSRDLTAYKGVESSRIIQRGVDPNGDGVLDEDPTSDVVPTGVLRGEYIATFSIQRQDLVNCQPSPCTLSLRKPGQTAADAPFWSLRLELDKMTSGQAPGVVYDDFVFEITPGDFGDAPPPWPSRLLADNGGRSLNNNLEWFGPNQDGGVQQSDLWEEGVSPEPNALAEANGPDASIDPDGTPNILRAADLDRFDQGVVFYPRTFTPGNRNGRSDFTVCVADKASTRYANVADKSLWVNGWIDWNTNGVWQEAGNEHVVDGARIFPRDWSVTGQGVSRLRENGNCATFKALFTVPAVETGELWARFRVDYGENVGRNDPRPDNNRRDWRSDPSLRDPSLATNQPQPAGQGKGYTQGASRFGEVEDYLLGTDYGDAKDTPYPTKHASRGGYSLNFNQEWLGPDADYANATREVDGCDTTTAEEDRVPNLGGSCTGKNQDGKEDGATVPAQVAPGEEIVVEVTVSSQIDTRGYANRGPGGQNSAGVQTLQPNCTLGAIGDADDTPVVHRGLGRYAAWQKEKRIFLNAWADWNADGVWGGGDEYILQHLPVDPETFGADGKYTLGEPFVDANKNGVRDQNETYTDVAGAPSRTFACRVRVPEDVARNKEFFWRFRVDYGEDVAENAAVVRFAVLPEGEGRNLSLVFGGSWWGEVEDYPSIAPLTPTKGSAPSTVRPGETIHYSLMLPANPELQQPTTGWMVDQLPQLVEFAGNLACSSGNCQYDPSQFTVRWQGPLAPGETVTMNFDVRVPTSPPSCPPTIVNSAPVYDGVTVTTVMASTALVCTGE